MMRTPDKVVFEAFKVSPKRFTRFLLELHDIFPNESGLMNWIELLQEDLDETICHAPLPKIRGNGVATRVGDVYTRGKYPTYIR